MSTLKTELIHIHGNASLHFQADEDLDDMDVVLQVGGIVLLLGC